MGWSLPAELIGPALEDWAKWGQARHDYFLRAAALARAIEQLRQSPETARRMGQIGRRRVEAKFTWRKVAEQMRDIYLAVCSERTPFAEAA